MLTGFGCARGGSAPDDAARSRLSCDGASQHKPVELEEVLIEVQNNAKECAVRVWARESHSPLFETKGALGIHNCKVYVIHNAEIRPKSNKLREEE